MDAKGIYDFPGSDLKHVIETDQEREKHELQVRGFHGSKCPSDGLRVARSREEDMELFPADVET